MKTIRLLLLFIPFSFVAKAQESKDYLQGGLKHGNFSIACDGRIYNADALRRCHVVISGDCPIGEIIHLGTGLLFSDIES